MRRRRMGARGSRNGFQRGRVCAGGYCREGLCLLSPTPFSCLDTRKGRKRKSSSHRGPGSWPDTGWAPLKWFPTGATAAWALLSAVRVGANCIRPSTYQQGTGAPDQKSLVMNLPLTGHLWGRMPYAPTLPADGMCPPLKWFPMGAGLCRGLLSWGALPPIPHTLFLS